MGARLGSHLNGYIKLSRQARGAGAAASAVKVGMCRRVAGMAVPAIGCDAFEKEPDAKEPLFYMVNIELATALKSTAFN